MIAELSRACGLDLGSYRSEHVAERVSRAFEREAVSTPERLVSLLARDPAARSRFRRSVAISVTGPFRDPQQFELLERTLLPPLLASGRRLTVWSAGCANGSELISVAVVLQRLGALDRAFLLGSDVLAENVEAARENLRTASPPGARIRFECRDIVREAPPPGRWRLVLCRNVAIYLTAEAKRTLHDTLARALSPGGVLLLGRSERLDAGAVGLEPVASRAYTRAA